MQTSVHNKHIHNYTKTKIGYNVNGKIEMFLSVIHDQGTLSIRHDHSTPTADTIISKA